MYPLSNRPKITATDVAKGYVDRYFVKYIGSRKIVEVDKQQYFRFVVEPNYQTLQIKWVINGNDEDVPTSGGQVLYGVRTQNESQIEIYELQFPGLRYMLPNPLEYFVGKKVKYIEKEAPDTPIIYSLYSSSITSSSPPPATLITVSPSSLTFNYEIGSTVPTSQSVSITANGTLSSLYLVSASSWVSASLSSSTAPTTVQILPRVTGLYSGSYSSTVIVNTTQIGVTSATVGITLNVTNNPDILFIYEPGMSLSTATFTRATSASFNELVS